MCVFGCHLKNQAHTHITFTSNLVVTHTLFQPPEWKNPVGFLQTYTEVQHFPSQAECGLLCETLLYPLHLFSLLLKQRLSPSLSTCCS